MTTTKPLIAIILDYEEKNKANGGFSDFPWYALRVHYSRAIALNGGIPIHISYEHELIEEYLKLFNGFIIPGGDYDISEAYNKAYISPNKQHPPRNKRTDFEIQLLKKILIKKIPFLGICAGHQLLNIFLGGTLYQDISSDIKTNIDHKHETKVDQDWHDIKLSTDSLLYNIVGKKKYKVNSHHQQAVCDVGKNLVACAIAPDGVIEAIEHTQHPFCLGVEWHPEYIKNTEDKKLIRAFIAAAKKYANSC